MKMLLKKKNFFNLFPVPNYLLLSSSGISIADDNIRLIQFKHGMLGEHLELANFAEAPTPESAVQGGYVYDGPKVSLVLAELAKKYGIQYAKATLPEEKAYLFTASIDRVPYEGLRDAVAFIIEENVPVTLADSVFDFDIFEDVPDSPKIEVAVSVLPKKVVETYIEIFEGAGITPISFDIESQAIARAVVKRGDSRTQLIVNLNADKTGFYIAENEVVQFTTTLPHGSNEEKPYPHINDLKMEMRKIFGFWGARRNSIEQVLVCGPGALSHDFVEKLMEDCPASYNLADPWVNAPLARGALPAEAIKKSFNYAPAIGLALPEKG